MLCLICCCRLLISHCRLWKVLDAGIERICWCTMHKRQLNPTLMLISLYLYMLCSSICCGLWKLFGVGIEPMCCWTVYKRQCYFGSVKFFGVILVVAVWFISSLLPALTSIGAVVQTLRPHWLFTGLSACYCNVYFARQSKGSAKIFSVRCCSSSLTRTWHLLDQIFGHAQFKRSTPVVNNQWQRSQWHCCVWIMVSAFIYLFTYFAPVLLLFSSEKQNGPRPTADNSNNKLPWHHKVVQGV